jgi:hypothetical protein
LAPGVRHRVDLGDRQARRVLVNERLDVGLAHRVATLPGDRFKRLRSGRTRR